MLAVSVGPKECQVWGREARLAGRWRRAAATDLSSSRLLQDQLRTALALGADRVLHVDTGTAPSPGPRGVAAALARVAAAEGPRLVLLGKQAIDGDANQTGQMLAGMMRWPQATFAGALAVDAVAGTATATREVDGGLQTLTVALPAVVTADLRLNTPRYASLPAVMKAKKAEIPCTPLADLGAAVAPQTRVVSLRPPPSRKPGVRVADAAELVRRLREEAKVL